MEIAIIRAASLTIIGLMTFWVAYQQKKISRQQLEVNEHRIKLDLYDRRWAVYDAIETFIGKVIHEGSLDAGDLYRLSRSTRHATYLFGDDVNTYLDELRKRGASLRRSIQESESRGGGDFREPRGAIEPEDSGLQWFNDQLDSGEFDEKFVPYLDVSRVGLQGRGVCRSIERSYPGEGMSPGEGRGGVSSTRVLSLDSLKKDHRHN